MTKNNSLLSFPCLFAIKALGVNSPDLVNALSEIIYSKCLDFNHKRDITTTLSKNGNYLSVTINIVATSKDHLDDIYLAINSSPLVKLTL